MSSYKLTYFDARGVAEPIRFIFAQANVKYEDNRIPILFDGDKPVIPPAIPQEIKQKCPWGQVPLLEIGDKKLAQSLAISRFLAKKFKLTGADEFEAAKCDELVDTVMDMFKEFRPVLMEFDQKKKAEVAEKLIDEVLGPKYFSKLDTIVAANGGKTLVGKQITWADLYVTAIMNSVMVNSKVDFTAKFSNLKKFVETVLSSPQIKTWIESRPKTLL